MVLEYLLIGGGGYAHSGQAYIGVANWFLNSNNSREYAGVGLTETLIPGKKYKVEFYVSLLDSLWYATKNIGAYFSIGQPLSDISILLSYEPQVKYTGTNFLDDKEGWIKIEGSFFADGGENFITIGNFNDDVNTDTFFVSGGGVFRPDQPTYWSSAGYFIDDVLVTLDTLTSINELQNVKFEVYPNPIKDIVTIETEIREKTELQLTDVAGRVLLSIELTNTKATIDMSAFSQGVYVAALLQNNVAVARTKIIKQ